MKQFQSEIFPQHIVWNRGHLICLRQRSCVLGIGKPEMQFTGQGGILTAWGTNIYINEDLTNPQPICSSRLVSCVARERYLVPGHLVELSLIINNLMLHVTL